MRKPWITALTFFAALLVSSAWAQAEFRWTFQSTWPAGDPHHLNFERWVEQIERYSGGRIQIETLPAGSIVPAFEVLDAINDGILDGGHAWSGYWIGKNRAAVMVSSGPAGPFGMDPWDYWGWQWLGGGREVNNRFFQEDLGMNVEWFPTGSTGAQSLGWFNRELRSIDDLRGLVYRIGGIGGEMYERLGASVITIPGGEIAAAGERGVIDAAEYVGPYIDLQMGFHDIWQYHYAPAYHELVTVTEVLIRGDNWESLPPDLQDIVELVTREHHIWWEQHQQRENMRAMNEMETVYDVAFDRTPQDILDESLRTWHEILEEEYTTNPAFKRIADSQLEWASQVLIAKRITYPNYFDLVDVYWGPGGFVEQADFLDFEYEVPAFYERFMD